MGHNKNLGFTKKSWFQWTTNVVFMLLALFATMTLEIEDKVEEEPSSGLLCISECVTCPTICSPPPPKLVTSNSNHPPPSLLTPNNNNPPPPPLLTSYTPPFPLIHPPNSPLLTQNPPPPPLLTSYPPPLPLTASHSPPPSPPLLKSYPPPSLSLPPPLLTMSPPAPSSHSSGEAPPPPLKSSPSSGSTQGQPNVIGDSPHNYPYPYYYYYASCASHFSNHILPFFIVLMFLHQIVFAC
uniref:Leucine-rich repeat extensin-like protein 3 n=1 Tax=Cicer arietinum TaxID=3827 RepID=A0A1S2Y3R4_CICAR|nr:leucine-rich repeat extensin-like protein 3 [Cicer arietinum]